MEPIQTTKHLFGEWNYETWQCNSGPINCRLISIMLRLNYVNIEILGIGFTVYSKAIEFNFEPFGIEFGKQWSITRDKSKRFWAA